MRSGQFEGSARTGGGRTDAVQKVARPRQSGMHVTVVVPDATAVALRAW